MTTWMSTKFGHVKGRSGLRNKQRSGIGTYSRLQKSRRADRYGTYINGRQTEPGRIGGRSGG